MRRSASRSAVRRPAAWSLAALVLFVSLARARASDTAKTAAGEPGIHIHTPGTKDWAGVTKIRVLLPARLEEGTRYTAIYVLPVEPRDEHRYGDGLREIARLGVAERHRAIFVAPSFSHLPWYADHPSDPRIRQERDFLEVVLPFVEGHYPVRSDRDGRLLLGFSKSGWGAWSLLLRHADRFGKAVAWDAPLMLENPGPYGSGAIFATQENFERYRVSRLLTLHGRELGNGRRLLLLGFGNFRDQHMRAHDLLNRLEIPHVYEDGPRREHIWESGWITGAVERLLE